MVKNIDNEDKRRPRILDVKWNKPNYDDIDRVYLKVVNYMMKNYFEAKRMWEKPGYFLEVTLESIEEMLKESIIIGMDGIDEMINIEGPGRDYALLLAEKLSEKLDKVVKEYKSVRMLNSFKNENKYLFN